MQLGYSVHTLGCSMHSIQVSIHSIHSIQGRLRNSVDTLGCSIHSIQVRRIVRRAQELDGLAAVRRGRRVRLRRQGPDDDEIPATAAAAASAVMYRRYGAFTSQGQLTLGATVATLYAKPMGVLCMSIGSRSYTGAALPFHDFSG